MYKRYYKNLMRYCSTKPKDEIRVRFAPSPTGGSYGPYVQSERIDLYREQVKTLLNNNTAYYCFCTSKRLELLRKEAVRTRQTPKYDNRCRYLNKDEVSKRLKNGENYCIRFKLSPDIQEFQDLIYGHISYDVTLIEGDPIIMKTDGFPTYHFANVVDDHFMKISHVLRGVEWQVSTTKHLMMYRAFGWDPPIYGHLPLLLNADGTKLSKRQGDIQISHYRNTGILSQALVNFITSSGGGFEKDLVRNVKPKCYSMDELIQQFDIAQVKASSGKLKPDRLDEFNRLDIQRLLQNPNEERVLIEQLRKLITNAVLAKNENAVLMTDASYIRGILNWAIDRITKVSDLISKDFMFLWIMPNYENDLRIEQQQILAKIHRIINEETKLNDWSKDNINEVLRTTAKEIDFPYNGLMKMLRNVLSGLKEGPSVAEMMFILGKENTIHRLKVYLEKTTK
ncbi:glutamate--trna ligase [Holotrichia oblita]|uniref:Glutamate--trna ligase n=1 Tax=Holotrichia oblita TaxID=644536 RepID=A0ACB9TCP6_HOLOL|nr:glutamate--trna ligase [Holotrichia oblita]